MKCGGGGAIIPLGGRKKISLKGTNGIRKKKKERRFTYKRKKKGVLSQ